MNSTPSALLPVDPETIVGALATTGMGVFITDLEGRYTWMNDRGAELIGYPREEAVGMLWSDLLDPAEAPDVEASWEQDGVSGDAFRVECRLRRGDGTWMWGRVRATALRDATGEITSYIGTVTNIDRERETVQALRDSQQLLSRILDGSSDIVTILDPDGTWRTSSAGGTRLMGWPTGFEPEGGIFSLVHPDDLESAQRAFAEVLAGERGPNEAVELRIRARDGAWHWFQTVAQNLVDDPAVRGVVLHSRDVTERRELDALKAAFFAAVGHDLRTPLTSIVSFTELLDEGLGIDPVEDQREYLAIIARNADRALRFVSDLLFLSRLDTHTVPLELAPVDVALLVRRATESFRAEAGTRGLRLDCETLAGPPLVADGDRITQLLDNLLNNAMKFTPSGGRVDVRAAPTGEGWRLVVTDTGIGIPAEELGSLFERSFRASNAREAGTDGSGLGLAIVDGIAQLHGGSVAVESTEGAGTTITVQLTGQEAPPA